MSDHRDDFADTGNDHMDDSERMPLVEDRRQTRGRRKIVRYLNYISAGSVGLIVTVASGFVGLYVGITADNARRDERIATIQRDRDSDRVQVAQTLQEIKSDLRDTTRAINETKENVATVKAQLTVLQQIRSPAR